MADGKSRSNLFHRTIELQIGYGCDTLRRLLNKQLDQMKITLKDHLNKKTVHSIFKEKFLKGKLFKDQYNLLYPNPKDENFDYSLLTLLLLNGKFRLTPDEEKTIKSLRELRNQLSHTPKAELPDDTIFIEARKLIVDVAGKCGRDFEKQMKQKIDELQAKELVTVRSNIDIVNLRNESFVVKLVENGGEVQTDTSDTTLLRYGLTKWVKRFTEIVHLDALLRNLLRIAVISVEEKKHVEHFYNKGEQCGALVMLIVDANDMILWTFLRCLRENQPHLADLIENKADDGADTESKLREAQLDSIKSAVRTYFEPDNNEKVVSEDIHIVVEKELGYGIPFTLVESAVEEEFGLKLSSDLWYCGMKWTKERDVALGIMDCGSQNADLGQAVNDDDVFVECNCEQFGDKVSKLIDNVKQGYGPLVRDAIVEECVTPSIFCELSDSDMKSWLNDYMQGKKLILGVAKKLNELQKGIMEQLQRTQYNGTAVTRSLRGFDSTCDDTTYQNDEIVKPPTGNLLTPVHEFRTLSKLTTSPKEYITRECVQFVCACVNSRKNGTIHFGIESIENGIGKIKGLQLPINIDLDMSVQNAIDACFNETHLMSVKRCMRSFQRVLVDNDRVVLEMDVVPSSLSTDDLFCTIKFPPKGKQTVTMFVFTLEPCPVLMNVPMHKIEDTKKIYKENMKDRKLLEVHIHGRKSTFKEHALTLQKRITANSRYVTDQYYPIIICGKITDTENESFIREHIVPSMADLFRESTIILDFDHSTLTRTNVEKHSSSSYKIKVAGIGSEKLIDITSTDSTWIYCNGNEDLRLPEMHTNEWFLKRSPVVKQAIADLRACLPQQRALLIFLFFESHANSDSPMAMIAEECMISFFRNECIAIASSEDQVAELKSNVLKRITKGENFEQHFHTNLQWKETANILRSVSHTSRHGDKQLPCNDGQIVYLTQTQLEKMNFTDIKVISGRQCLEVEEMDLEEQRTKMTEKREVFYRGDKVSWCNFHFDNQVGERDLYSVLLKSIRQKMTADDNLVEMETVLHHPGAGGTTAGRYLIWHLSQFKCSHPGEAYRCCIVRKITEHTADQIYDFMSFGDQFPKSVVVLIDNLGEENIGLLRDNLYEKAYRKHVAHNNVFCILVVVRRVPVAFVDKPGDHILKHHLSEKEQLWFENKYKELEKTDEIDVNTLISFNVMRNSFDKKYIREIAVQFLKGVREVELPVLKCLSLVNLFDRDSVIPITIFDSLMSGEDVKSRNMFISDLIGKGPVGLVVPFHKRRGVNTSSSPWSTTVTDEFSLLTKRLNSTTSKSEVELEYAGLMMISQELAKSVLFCIIESEGTSLPKAIEFVLQIVKEHVSKPNQMSKEFVKIINSLFKTRQLILADEGEQREKFSDMVMYLTRSETEDDNNDTVIELMRACFDITHDAMVGQQLARFYINMKDYEKAELVIKESIYIQQNNSYLLDTYGQIFFSKMDHLLTTRSSLEGTISDDDAAEVIHVLFNALDKFKAGQMVTSKEEGENTSCYYMEVKTLLTLLEGFSKFSCHQDEKGLLDFLNDAERELPMSYKELDKKCGLRRITRNSVMQAHADDSLRLLEERKYQIKRRLYTVPTGKDESLLLKLRERFERFYGSPEKRGSYKYQFGIGLKSLMTASQKVSDVYKTRVDEAWIKLQQVERKTLLKNADKRDLLVVLGNTVMEMSTKGAKLSPDEHPMDKSKYNALLRYSEELLEMERKSNRPYLEAFLYYTILNWPAESREDVDNLGRQEKLKNVLKDWQNAFRQNHKPEGRRRLPFPKTFFALGRGPLGCDIVDFSQIEKQWRERTGKRRQYVQDDQVWQKPYVKNILKRLEGTLNDTGKIIQFETKLQYWKYELNVACLQPSELLCNRRVSFILVFTWEGPKATDIKDVAAKGNIEDDGPSSLEERDTGGNGEDKRRQNQSERRPGKNSSWSSNPQGKSRSKKGAK